MNEYQRLYEDLQAKFRRQLIEAKQLNTVAHLELLKELQSLINTELTDMGVNTDFDNF